MPACLDAIVAKGACPNARVEKGKDMLIRIVSMLTKLVLKFEETRQLHEDSNVYETASERA